MNVHSARFSLAGKTALITGARRGIGRAIATAFADAGASVIGVSQQASPHDAVADDVRARGGGFWAYACDLSDRQQVLDLIRTVRHEHEPLGVLVANAGSIARIPAVDHDDVTWDRVIAIDLTAPFVLAREFGRDMVERGSGKIIFTASVLSFQGGVLVPSYTAAKSALAGVTRALANEWAGFGVNVNAIAPGYIETDNTVPLRADAARSSSILARIPAGRWGRAEDVAGAAIFLASPASDYVHGHVLLVDGGWLGR